MIWAQSPAGVIGRDGGLPWRLPEDMVHFRALTTGHTVIMGRRTWQSLPSRFRPLPQRRNIVVSRQPGFDAPGADAVVGSVPAALALVPGDQQAWVAGGAQVYAAARDLAEFAEVTEVHVDVPGDTFAPSLDTWTRHHTGAWHTSRTGLRYRFLHYTKSGSRSGDG